MGRPHQAGTDQAEHVAREAHRARLQYPPYADVRGIRRCYTTLPAEASKSLWYSDLKYGPYLPIGPDGAMKQVFLVTFIDDATRFVLHGEFYPVMDKTIVEDCFRRAIQKYGVPEAVYFDNGKQYRTKWMTRACSKLGIRLLFAKPYSPESTGKVERFNRVVDSFLSEAALEKRKTLDRLNELFQVWLSECYQNKPHSAPTTVVRCRDRRLRNRKDDDDPAIYGYARRGEVQGALPVGFKVDAAAFLQGAARTTRLRVEVLPRGRQASVASGD